MVIIVDAMGGDNAPEEIIKGCVSAVNKSSGFDILLVGIEDVIERILSRYRFPADRISIRHASEVIENDDIPTKAIRSKKDSSMVVGFNALKSGEGDAFLSAGNTGALLTGASIIIHKIKGVLRPALAPVLPTKTGQALLIDAGSNSECSPENLQQFAIMGSCYMRNVFGIENPKVGLVNIGAEEKKGNDLARSAYTLLSNTKNINFYGNIEGREIPQGDVDVVVCDGFVGNVILKLMEGMGKSILQMMKEEFTRTPLNALGALLLKRGLRDFKKKMDYREYGGAPFLGVDGIVVKSHGSSDACAIENAVLVTKRFVETKVIEQIKNDLINMEDGKLDSGE